MDFSASYSLEWYPFFGRLIWREHAVFDSAMANTSCWKDRVVVLDMQNQGFSSFWELKCLVPLRRECFVNDLGPFLLVPILHPDIRITSASQIRSNKISGFNYN
uniref:NTMC2T3 n=1 Tax=Arundo donax TaxID=35708 RepID=A0A0A9DJ68_ARUDO